MKRYGCLILCLALLLLSGCSLLRDPGRSSASAQPPETADGPEEDVISEPEGGEFLSRCGYEVMWIGTDAYGIVSCEEGDFSTLVSFPMSQLWEEGTGLYLSMKISRPGTIPYVIVSRNRGVSLDAEEYLNGRFLHEMQESYGEDLLSFSKAEAVTVGGRQLWQMELAYALPDEGVTVLMRRLCGTIDDSFVIFTAKKTSQDNDAIFTSLEEIVAWYKNGASAYVNGARPPEKTDGQKPDGQGPDGVAAIEGYGAYSVKSAEPVTLGTITVSNEIFTMEVPENWTLTTHKQFSDFGVYLYDPQVPERKIFFYCKMEYFNKSQAEKDYYANLASIAGVTRFDADPYGYLISASVPVLDPATTARFYQLYPDFIQLLYQVQGYGCLYPDLNGVTVLEQYASNAPVTPTAKDNSILRIAFTSDSGTRCQGLVGGEVSDKITYFQDGIDLGNYCVYDMMGVTAPEAEFAELEPTLLRCLTSFSFTDGYVRQTQQNTANETDAILAAGRSMQAVYDSYNAAWHSRQTDYDILSQKNSDAVLGYDRLYDPDTDEVYRAEAGFYEQYDLNRSAYANPNLQILDDATEQYYLKSVDYYISK